MHSIVTQSTSRRWFAWKTGNDIHTMAYTAAYAHDHIWASVRPHLYVADHKYAHTRSVSVYYTRILTVNYIRILTVVQNARREGLS